MGEELSKVTHLPRRTHPGPQSLSRVHLAYASLSQSAKTEPAVRGAKFAAGYCQQRQQWDVLRHFTTFPLPLTFFFIFSPEAPILHAA